MRSLLYKIRRQKMSVGKYKGKEVYTAIPMVRVRRHGGSAVSGWL